MISSISFLVSAVAFSSIVTATTPAPTCGANADNCRRAVIRASATNFCNVYTQGLYTEPALPTFATQCTGSTASRLSSACTCYMKTATTSTTPPVVTPTSCYRQTIQNGGFESSTSNTLSPPWTLSACLEGTCAFTKSDTNTGSYSLTTTAGKAVLYQDIKICATAMTTGFINGRSRVAQTALLLPETDPENPTQVVIQMSLAPAGTLYAPSTGYSDLPGQQVYYYSLSSSDVGVGYREMNSGSAPLRVSQFGGVGADGYVSVRLFFQVGIFDVQGNPVDTAGGTYKIAVDDLSYISQDYSNK